MFIRPAAWHKHFGKTGEFASTIGTPKGYGVGALIMAPAGLATALYSFATGTSLTTTSETAALWTIIASGVLLVILIITALVLISAVQEEKTVLTLQRLRSMNPLERSI